MKYSNSNNNNNSSNNCNKEGKEFTQNSKAIVANVKYNRNVELVLSSLFVIFFF